MRIFLIYYNFMVIKRILAHGKSERSFAYKRLEEGELIWPGGFSRTCPWILQSHYKERAFINLYQRLPNIRHPYWPAVVTFF